MSVEHVTVMNRTSRTFILSSPVGMKEEVLHVGDNRIPRAVWEYSVTCCPSLGRDPKLFVVPEAPASGSLRNVISVEIKGDVAEAKAVIAEVLKAPAPSIADMTASEAKRVIEQTTDLDALDAWTADSRKGVATAAQKRIDALMVSE